MAPELVEWREFFVTTATVAGALVGLLFIAISLHLPLLSDDRHADLRLDARSILIGYVFALALSLLPLIPQSLAALGEELLVLFLYMIATTIWAVPRLLRTRTALYGRRNLWFRVALLTAGTAATLSGALALAAGAAWALQLLAASVLILIFVSVFRTWDIVFRAARATDR